MGSHIYNFDGGKDLSSMSASWFVSYCYYQTINPNHLNWAIFPERISTYKRTTQYHKFWLQKIVCMNAKNLDKNTIQLSGTIVIEMAKELLNIINR